MNPDYIEALLHAQTPAEVRDIEKTYNNGNPAYVSYQHGTQGKHPKRPCVISPCLATALSDLQLGLN